MRRSGAGQTTWMMRGACRLLAWYFLASTLLLPAGLPAGPVPRGLLDRAAQGPLSPNRGPVEDDTGDAAGRTCETLQESWLRPVPAPVHRRDPSFGTGIALLNDDGRAVRSSLRSGPFLASGRELRRWLQSHIC